MIITPINPFIMVGARGFEPPASWSRTKRATKLRYAPPNQYHDYSTEVWPGQ